jgi:hypothetical protein
MMATWICPGGHFLVSQDSQKFGISANLCDKIMRYFWSYDLPKNRGYDVYTKERFALIAIKMKCSVGLGRGRLSEVNLSYESFCIVWRG